MLNFVGKLRAGIQQEFHCAILRKTLCGTLKMTDNLLLLYNKLTK